MANPRQEQPQAPALEWDDSWSFEDKIKFLSAHSPPSDHSALQPKRPVFEDFDSKITDNNNGQTLLELAIQQEQFQFIFYVMKSYNHLGRRLPEQAFGRYSSKKLLMEAIVSYIQKRPLYPSEQAKKDEEKDNDLDQPFIEPHIYELVSSQDDPSLDQTTKEGFSYLLRFFLDITNPRLLFITPSKIASFLKTLYYRKLKSHDPEFNPGETLPNTIAETETYWEKFKLLHQQIKPQSVLFDTFSSFMQRTLEQHKKFLTNELSSIEKLAILMEQIQEKDFLYQFPFNTQPRLLKELFINVCKDIKEIQGPQNKLLAATFVLETMDLLKLSPESLAQQSITEFSVRKMEQCGAFKQDDNISILFRFTKEQILISKLQSVKNDRTATLEKKLALIKEIYIDILDGIDPSELHKASYEKLLTDFTSQFPLASTSEEAIVLHATLTSWHQNNLNRLTHLNQKIYPYHRLVELLKEFVYFTANPKIEALQNQERLSQKEIQHEQAATQSPQATDTPQAVHIPWDDNWSFEKKIKFLSDNLKLLHPGDPEDKRPLSFEDLELRITDNSSGETLLELAIQKKQFPFVCSVMSCYQSFRKKLPEKAFGKCLPQNLLEIVVAHIQERPLYPSEEAKDEEEDAHTQILESILSAYCNAINEIHQTTREELGQLRNFSSTVINKDFLSNTPRQIACYLKEVYQKKLPDSDFSEFLPQGKLPDTVAETNAFLEKFNSLHEQIQPPSPVFNTYSSFMKRAIEQHKKFLNNALSPLEKLAIVIEQTTNEDFKYQLPHHASPSSLKSLLINLYGDIRKISEFQDQQSAITFVFTIIDLLKSPLESFAQQSITEFAESWMKQSPAVQQGDNINISILFRFTKEQMLINKLELAENNPAVTLKDKLELIKEIYTHLLSHIDQKHLDSNYFESALIAFTNQFSEAISSEQARELRAKLTGWHEQNAHLLVHHNHPMHSNPHFYHYLRLVPLLKKFVNSATQPRINELENQERPPQREVQREPVAAQASPVAQVPGAPRVVHIPQAARKRPEEKNEIKHAHEETLKKTEIAIKALYKQPISEPTTSEIFQPPTIIRIVFKKNGIAPFVFKHLKTIPSYPSYEDQHAVNRANFLLNRGRGNEDNSIYNNMYITLEQAECIQKYHQERIVYWQSIHSTQIPAHLATPEVAAQAISLLYSKNCRVGDSNEDVYEFLFDNEVDANHTHQQLQIDIPSFGAVPNYNYTNTGVLTRNNKSYLLMSPDEYKWYIKKILYDFDIRLKRVRELLDMPNHELSPRTVAHLNKLLTPLEAKRKDNSLSFDDIKKFEEDAKNLPMPLTLRLAIGALVTAAFLVAAVFTVGGAPVAIMGTVAAAAGFASLSMWYFKDNPQQEKDKNKISDTLKNPDIRRNDDLPDLKA